MAIFEKLSLEDYSSKPSHNHFYNGPLSDYIESSVNSYAQYNSFFEELKSIAEDVRVCAELPIKINHQTISNQIIRYRDAFKLPEDSLRIPLILYWKKGEAEKAILLSTTTYIEAKGYYYCLTEPNTDFSDARNEVLALVLNDNSLGDIKQAFDNLYNDKRATGAVQRSLDRKYLVDVDEMKEQCIELAKGYFDNAMEQLYDMDEKGDLINATIGKVFLIKKALYVQYMMSKEILTTRHEGDVKKQRQFAKAYADEIPIVSLSAMWRATREETEEPTEERTEETE